MFLRFQCIIKNGSFALRHKFRITSYRKEVSAYRHFHTRTRFTKEAMRKIYCSVNTNEVFHFHDIY